MKQLADDPLVPGSVLDPVSGVMGKKKKNNNDGVENDKVNDDKNGNGDDDETNDDNNDNDDGNDEGADMKFAKICKSNEDNAFEY